MENISVFRQDVERLKKGLADCLSEESAGYSLIFKEDAMDNLNLEVER